MEFSSNSGKMAEIIKLLNFVADRDAKTVQKACDGLGTDDAMLISVLCSRTKKQLGLVDSAFSHLNSGRHLQDIINSECGGYYKKFLQYACQQREEYLCACVCKAMDGLGCDQSLINEVFCTATTEEISGMKTLFEERFDTQLSDKLRKELSGEHETLIIHLLLHGRGNGPADEGQAAELAAQIHLEITNGGGMMGGLKDTAKRNIGRILCESSPALCLAIQAAWDQAYSSEPSLVKTLKDKLSGDFENACLLLLKEPTVARCEQIKEAIEGIGTDEDALSRCLGGVDKVHAMEIAAMYQSKYNKSLLDDIRGEVGGDYSTALVTWLSVLDPTGGLEAALQSTAVDSPDFNELADRVIGNIKNSIAALDVAMLKYACKGLGTDERLVVSILCARTKSQLDAIDNLYRQTYGRTLREYIHKEMGGDLAKFLSYAQMTEAEFDAHILKNACDGLGTDEDAIIEVVCTRSFDRLIAAKNQYETANDSNLLDRLRGELSGSLKEVVCHLFTRPRFNDQFDPDASAKELYNAGAGRFGTQEEKFVEIFTSHSVEQMQEIARIYEVLCGNSLEYSVSSEFSGDAEKILQLLLLDPIDIYCRRLKQAMDGMGTNESAICRIIAGNEKELVQQISQRFQEKYNQSLVQSLASELSGDFKSAVVTYICTSDVTDGLEALNFLLPPPAMRPPTTVSATSDSNSAPAAAAAPAPLPHSIEEEPEAKEEESKTPPAPSVHASSELKDDLFDEKGVPLVMRGWGTKEGHFIRNWKRRHFVLLSTLDKTTLGYYVNSSDKKPFGENEKGMLNLRNYSVAVNGELIHVTGPQQDDKDLKIIVENPNEQDKWVQMLNTHIEYRKQRDDKKRAAQLKAM